MKNKFQYNLTDEEWEEIVVLDYVLIWHYTDDYDRDLRRYQELVKRKYSKWQKQ